MNTLRLAGCSPTPLAHYLKALGILRLLFEQLPANAPRPRGAWRGEAFVLHTHLDREALEHFFLHDYSPTPILAPWNGGSGFASKDKKQAAVLKALEKSEGARFAAYRESIGCARATLASLGLEEKPEGDAKEPLLLACRGTFPERLLEWLDAALVLTDGGAKYPPLLGTGGNDGRLEFTNNHMQRLGELFDAKSGGPLNTAALLESSLFGTAAHGLADNAIGQFFPHAAGGANSTSGFDGKALVNPWDFVLMLEGALLFAAAAVKRLESTGGAELAYPFSVRPSGLGYASASGADAEGARCEMWVPLWERPATLGELRQVLGEGRAQLKKRAARDGLEFGRAVVSLGVDRGLSAFQRYSFQPRNGLAFFATPLDRVPVQRRQRVTDLLDDLDRNDWLDRVRRAARGDRVPNRVASAVRQLEQAALGLCRSSQHDAEECAAAEALLLAVADAENALAHSLRWTQEKGLRPIRSLSSHWWTSLRNRDDAEFDLAAGLAGISGPCLRIHWEPVDGHPASLNWDKESREVFWADSRLEDSLLTIHQRRILLAKDKAVERVRYAVRPSSVARFLEGTTDDLYLARLARALSLIDLPFDADRRDGTSEEDNFEKACGKLPALFSLPRLALAGTVPGRTEPMPRLAAILRRGASGDGAAATALATQRLRGSGFAPALPKVPTRGPAVRRALAATLFPLSSGALDALAEHLRPLRMHD